MLLYLGVLYFICSIVNCVLFHVSPQLVCPVVVQVVKVRNVCAARAAEGGDGVGGSGRLLKVTVTDGLTSYHAIEFTACDAIRCVKSKLST